MLYNYNLSYWLPWLNFYTETMVLQIFIISSLTLFLYATITYYALIYMLVYIILISVFLAYYNLEVLSGFLLVVEFTAFFVMVLFLLALNFEGRLTNKNLNLLNFLWLLPGSYLFFLSSFSKPVSLENLNALYCWDDFYEDLAEDYMNDIVGLFLSYYSFNSFLFFLFGLLLFFATLVCVNLFKIIRVQTQEHLVSFQYVFKFFKDLLSFDFLRKQTSYNQTARCSGTRLVRLKKKSKNVAKK